jgi:TPR repeat protein
MIAGAAPRALPIVTFRYNRVARLSLAEERRPWKPPRPCRDLPDSWRDARHAQQLQRNEDVKMNGRLETTAITGTRCLTRLCTVLAVFLTAMTFAGAVLAGTFEDAAAAYNRGDYSTALKLYLPLANAGMSMAQYNVGIMYSKGLGAPQDYAEAMTWYRRAADQGLAAAGYALGVIYASGQGVAQDYAKAMKWFRAAADQGFCAAQYNVGAIHLKGRGVAQDYARAMKWFRTAADQGFAAAQYGVGYMYLNGNGVPQDYIEAARWFRLAADQGDEEAQYGLGSMYSTGQGVPQNPVEALKWFDLAIAGLDGRRRDRAVQARDLAKSRMTPQQIAESRKLAREWSPTP